MEHRPAWQGRHSSVQPEPHMTALEHSTTAAGSSGTALATAASANPVSAYRTSACRFSACTASAYRAWAAPASAGSSCCSRAAGDLHNHQPEPTRSESRRERMPERSQSASSLSDLRNEGQGVTATLTTQLYDAVPCGKQKPRKFLLVAAGTPTVLRFTQTLLATRSVPATKTVRPRGIGPVRQS